MYYAIALLAGGIAITNMIINSKFSEKAGMFSSVLVNFLGGLFVITLGNLFNGGMKDLDFSRLSDVPVYALFGGLLGLTIVMMCNKVVSNLPAVYSTLLMFTGQIGAAIFIDYLRTSEMHYIKLMGGALIVFGMVYNFKIDSKEMKNVLE